MKHERSVWILDFIAPDKDRGRVIELITPSELAALPKGTVLVAIDGDRVKVGGSDQIATDTLGGFIAYGLPVEWQP